MFELGSEVHGLHITNDLPGNEVPCDALKGLMRIARRGPRALPCGLEFQTPRFPSKTDLRPAGTPTRFVRKPGCLELVDDPAQVERFLSAAYDATSGDRSVPLSQA